MHSDRVEFYVLDFHNGILTIISAGGSVSDHGGKGSAKERVLRAAAS
jgi:hypothetical protein